MRAKEIIKKINGQEALQILISDEVNRENGDALILDHLFSFTSVKRQLVNSTFRIYWRSNPKQMLHYPTMQAAMKSWDNAPQLLQATFDLWPKRHTA